MGERLTVSKNNNAIQATALSFPPVDMESMTDLSSIRRVLHFLEVGKKENPSPDDRWSFDVFPSFTREHMPVFMDHDQE